MNELALFAGAGGGILGGKLLGWRTVCAVEINAFCARRLMQRQNEGHLPPFPIWDDVSTFDGRPWKGSVDVVSGGFPCQAFSTACHGKYTAPHLWDKMFRIIGEACPRFVFAENVDEGAIASAQKDLADCGYKTVRGRVSAGQLGADHIRRRWWLVADSDNKSELGCEINAKTSIFKESGKSLWKTHPAYCGIPNGVADRVVRYRAIGNGQVPAVVKLAWEILGPK